MDELLVDSALPVGLASILGTSDARRSKMMAGAMLIALHLLIMFMLLSHYFINGLPAEALEG
ncbi:MAG TPA: hypothetical protein PLI90_08005 [Rhodocyclaceae bacterium]|nr:hypothetical protein [Rhodocyclaceae bacterium]